MRTRNITWFDFLLASRKEKRKRIRRKKANRISTISNDYKYIVLYLKKSFTFRYKVIEGMSSMVYFYHVVRFF